MSTANWFILVPAILLVLGAALGFAGWRGRRVGDHPLCRRCGFDLHGRSPDSERCPECGTDLHAGSAIVFGHRRRRTGLLSLGLLLLLPSLLWLSAVAWIVARRVDVTQYKPVWWLTRDAAATDPALRHAAMTEIATRYRSSKLSDAQASSVVDALLDLQGDTTREWDTRWGDFIEDVMAAAKLSASQKERYLRQAPQLELNVRPAARRGAYLPARVRCRLRVASRTRISGDALWMGAEFATGPWNPLRATIPFRSGSMIMLIPLDDPLFRGLSDGSQHLRVQVRVRCYDGPHPDNQNTPPSVEQTVTLVAPWTLVDAAAPTVRLVTDDRLWPSIRDSLRPRVHVNDVDGLRADVSGRPIDAVDLAFATTIRSGTDQWYLGEDTSPRGEHVFLSFQGIRPAPPVERQRLDLILEPNIDAAEQTVDITEIWGTSIIFRALTTHAADDVRPERLNTTLKQLLPDALDRPQ